MALLAAGVGGAAAANAVATVEGTQCPTSPCAEEAWARGLALQLAEGLIAMRPDVAVLVVRATRLAAAAEPGLLPVP